MTWLMLTCRCRCRCTALLCSAGVKEVGDIFLKFSFAGPAGIAYPQFRPEVDSFDDTLRKIPDEKDAEPAAAVRPDLTWLDLTYH